MLTGETGNNSLNDHISSVQGSTDEKLSWKLKSLSIIIKENPNKFEVNHEYPKKQLVPHKNEKEMGTMKIKNREKWDFLLLTELRSQLGAIKNWAKTLF
jgi:hypothetical protein